MSNAFDVFISGNEIDLVVLEEATVLKTGWHSWFNDEDLTYHTGNHHYYPNTLSMQMEYFKTNIDGNREHIQLGIVHKKNSEFIGVGSISKINMLHRNCEVTILIGSKKHHNIKLFVESISLLIRHAFDHLNMEKVSAGTMNYNISLALQRMLGFTLEGVKRCDIYKHGRYHDCYMLSILRSEYHKEKIYE